MVRRAVTRTTIAVCLAMVAVLVMGLAGPVSAFAAAKKPVVSKISRTSGWNSGGTTVVITGKHFKVHGHKVVTRVSFGHNAAVNVRVKSATSITVTAPAGEGAVHVRVTTKAGRSARCAGDMFTYRVPIATQMAINAGDGQTASLGAAVATAPSVIVKDAKNDPIAGVTVTFAVATGGGSVTGAAAVSNASGIATVGSWKLGAVVGANTLTATCAGVGVAGSPVTFTATSNAGVLVVQAGGTPVRAYSLDELKALPPFVGYAGLNKTPVLGPDAVTGVKITDIVKDALGTPLAATQSVDVAEVDATPYNKVMSYDLLVNFAGITMYDINKVAVPSPAGPLAAVLVHSDPAGVVMPAANGPLRFFVADATEQLVFGPTNLSVSKVNQLNVFTP